MDLDELVIERIIADGDMDGLFADSHFEFIIQIYEFKETSYF